MSSISQTGEKCRGMVTGSAVVNFLKSLVTFFKFKPVIRTPRIYHGDYSYQSMPEMAIVNFMHIKNVTFVETGDCYVYIFDKPQYQGNYIITGPKEVIPICQCGSLVISRKKLPVSMIQKVGKPPKGIWELTGAGYQYHFGMGYKYV